MEIHLRMQRNSCKLFALIFLLLNLNNHMAYGRPDVRQSPFALELQPPLVDTPDQTADFNERAVDSYGNPIDSLHPIDTPDGRKVVSAQGLQFEIPTYASGITEIRKPADDLLPPHIGEFFTAQHRTRGAASGAADGGVSNNKNTKNKNSSSTTNNNTNTTTNTKSNHKKANANAPLTRTRTRTTSISISPSSIVSNHIKRQITNQTHLTTSTPLPQPRNQKFPIAPPSPEHAAPPFSLLTLNPVFRIKPSPRVIPKMPSNLCPFEAKYSTQTHPSQLDAIAVDDTPRMSSTSNISDINTSTTYSTSSFAPPTLAISLTPPHQTTSTEVEVEQAHLVPLPEQQQQQQQQQQHHHHQQQQQRQESVHAPQLASGTLPDYIRELQLQDANIGGPVAWTPATDGAQKPLSVIAWDLLPPFETETEHETEPQIITAQQPNKYVQGIQDPITHNIQLSLSSGGNGLNPVDASPITEGRVEVVTVGERQRPEGPPSAHGTNAHVGSTTTPRNPGRFPNRQRGTAHYSTTKLTTTTRRPTTSTTTLSTTTLSTTTLSTTTSRRPTTTQAPRSTTPLDPASIYKLEKGEEEYAYTLPPWLQEVTDSDLDVAVTFIVPTDNDQYNHTLANDLEPPFEPFVDLNNVQLTPPPTTAGTTTTTTTPRTTTTATTTTSTSPKPVTHSTITSTTSTARPRTTQKPQIKPITTTLAAPDKKPEDADLTNPFDSATIPTWLRDFDYPDVGPGVPFNPDNFKDPPAGQGIGVGVSGGSKPNDFKPQGFTASTGTSANIPVTSKITTSTPKPFPIPTTLAVSSAFPSKVTLTLPELNQQQGPGDEDTNTVEPPSVLIPPLSQPLADETVSSSLPVDYNPSTNSIINFAARFDTAVSHQPTEPPRPATDESFPPFNTGNADTNHKVEYTKSDEGKVISTPVISNQQTPAPAPAAQPAVNPGKYTGGFGAPAGLLRPQVASKPDIYVAGDQHEFSNNVKGTKARPTSNPGRYNGGFGAPSGVLSPHSSEPPRPFQPQQRQHQPELVSAASSHSTTSRFGGPPGILVPFDNVQRSEGQ
ncbi:mucin-5AC isoform X2 [Drosophila willistoni]|uniref:mucin-5AC isoform X2 n=1 Tax=Drosophila willistoni TaxID=7260 RepID=UPI000C26D57F|nr:mucin-5AC isoform X2 [Drosophila willistoni]